MLGKDIEISRVPLSADNASIVSGFCCGADGVDLSDYLCNEALNDNECVTYLYLSNDKRPIAFFSLACTALVHKLGDPASSITKYAPAILIDKFAVDENFQGMPYDESSGFTLSQIIFADVINLIMGIAASIIGAKYIVLFSNQHAHHFYLKCCFEDFSEYMDKPSDPRIDDCIPMYYQL